MDPFELLKVRLGSPSPATLDFDMDFPYVLEFVPRGPSSNMQKRSKICLIFEYWDWKSTKTSILCDWRFPAWKKGHTSLCFLCLGLGIFTAPLEIETFSGKMGPFSERMPLAFFDGVSKIDFEPISTLIFFSLSKPIGSIRSTTWTEADSNTVESRAHRYTQGKCLISDDFRRKWDHSFGPEDFRLQVVGHVRMQGSRQVSHWHSSL